MGRRGGFICYAAPPPILRHQALAIHALQVRSGGWVAQMDYHYLADHAHSEAWCDGEVQIFADYEERVASAWQARRDVVAWPNQQGVSEPVQEAISERRDQIQWRRRRNRSSLRGRR